MCCHVSVCLCICVLTSVRACMHEIGGGGGGGGYGDGGRETTDQYGQCGEVIL